MRAGIPDGLYEIAGEHEPVPPAPDFLFLRPAPHGGGNWEIGVFERGVHAVSERFTSEDRACRRFLEILAPGAVRRGGGALPSG